MKRIVLLISFVAAVALCAGAQVFIDFHDMPIATTPTLMPDLYPSGMNMLWDSFYYVTPGMWSEAGPGFWVDPATQHNSVAFFGGPMCALSVPCSGSIKESQIVMTPRNRTFIPVGMIASSGWADNEVTVLAYNNSRLVGKLVWKLTTERQRFYFPAAWNVTQLVFTPGFINANTTNPKPGSMVIYDFAIMAH